MTLQYSTTLRNDRLDCIETTIGPDPILRLFDGTMPADCGIADAGTLLVEMTLPTDWMDPAAGGTKSKAGTWQVLAATAGGTAQYFRIYEATGTTAHIQGECTNTAGAGPLKLSTTTITSGEPVTIVTFTLTAGNA